MIAAVQAAADSWDAFVAAVDAESAALGELGRCALALTDALVKNNPADIEHAQRVLEFARVGHLRAAGARRAMQQRGFGTMTLSEVSSYASPAHASHLRMRIAEMSYGFAALGITNSNNKALILGGMDRLVKVVSVLQKSSTEQTGTYKRRGTVPVTDGSVLVSRRA